MHRKIDENVLHTRILTKIEELEHTVERDETAACDLRAQAERLGERAAESRTLLEHFKELLDERSPQDANLPPTNSDESEHQHQPAQEQVENVPDRGASCTDAIRHVVAQAPQAVWSNADIAHHLPDIRRATISVTVSRLVERGELERIDKGKTRATPHLGHDSLGVLHERVTTVLALDSSRCWSPQELAEATEFAAGAWLWTQLADMATNKLIYRNEDGAYQAITPRQEAVV